jgi:hypothetical protein
MRNRNGSPGKRGSSWALRWVGNVEKNADIGVSLMLNRVKGGSEIIPHVE